jgi:LacI family transcriptional regulator
LAARYLISKGVENPSYIAVDPPAQANADRYAGFTDELAKHGMRPGQTFNAALSEEDGYRVGCEIIESKSCDGVFCYCDDIAAGVVRAVRERRASLKVVGFDGVRITEHMGLSTVSQEPGRIGTQAATIIVQIMQMEKEPDPVRHCITPVLIDRNS